MCEKIKYSFLILHKTYRCTIDGSFSCKCYCHWATTVWFSNAKGMTKRWWLALACKGFGQQAFGSIVHRAQFHVSTFRLKRISVTRCNNFSLLIDAREFRTSLCSLQFRSGTASFWPLGGRLDVDTGFTYLLHSQPIPKA